MKGTLFLTIFLFLLIACASEAVPVEKKPTPAPPSLVISGEARITDELEARYDELCLTFQSATMRFKADLITPGHYRETVKQVWFDLMEAEMRNQLKLKGWEKREWVVDNLKKDLRKQFAETPETMMFTAMETLQKSCGEARIFIKPQFKGKDVQ